MTTKPRRSATGGALFCPQHVINELDADVTT
jgi:hypothetical protein